MLVDKHKIFEEKGGSEYCFPFLFLIFIFAIDFVSDRW
jgi:hypothetical protein